MNVLKRVKEFLTFDKAGDFGINNVLPTAQQESLGVYKRVLEGQSRLNLPKVISGELARLVCLEFKSKIKGSKRGEFLDRQLGNFLPKLREITEAAAGLGGVVLKPYISGDGIGVSCVEPDMFLPTHTGSDGRILGGVFLDKTEKDGRIYTRLEAHRFCGDEYLIENKCFVSDKFGGAQREIPLFSVSEWKSIKPSVTISGLKTPLFAYFKMPSARASLPFGEAVFARAMSLIEDAEAQYGRILWEFESGERALYIDEAAVRRDEGGKRSLPDKRLYRMVNQENLFEDWTPQLRDVSLLNGLDEILRRIEFNTGLAYGTLSRVQNGDKTAEEIRASKQRSYAKVTEIQGALKTALLDLIAAMDALCDLYSLADKGEYSVAFEFDDSIVADRTREFDERLALFGAGVISKEELKNWYFGSVKNTE